MSPDFTELPEFRNTDLLPNPVVEIRGAEKPKRPEEEKDKKFSRSLSVLEGVRTEAINACKSD